MRSRSVLAGLLIFLSACAGCRNEGGVEPAPGRQTGARGGRLVVAERTTPATFNYLVARDGVSLYAGFFLMSSRLVEFDHDAQQFVPGLAEWQVEEGRKAVTVRLREGLKFSDGAPLTADDVLFTIKLIFDPQVHSPVFYDGTMIGGQPIKATKIDARTVRLDLPQSVAAPEAYLYNIGVLPRHKLEAAYERGEFTKAWATTAAPSDFAGSGPFVVKEYVAGQRTVLARNEHYWKKDAAGTQLPYLDEIVVEAVDNANTRRLKFEQGELDVLDNIRPADYAELKDKPGAIAVRDLGPWLQTDFFWFNLNDGRDAQGKPFVDPVKRAWFADLRFRRAVSHAIDRPGIIQNVLRGLGTPLKGFFSPSNKRWVNPDLPAQDYDLNRAQELLKEAGFGLRGEGESAQLLDAKGNPVEFTLIVAENVAERRQMATIIQEDLKKLGIKVNVSPLEDKAFLPYIAQSFNYEAAIHGLSPSDTDPSSTLSAFKTTGQQRYWFISQKQPAADWERRLDQLIDEQAVEGEVAKRKEKVAEAQRIFAEQLPMIPLVVRHFISGAKADLGNYRPSFLPPRSLWNADELFWKK